MAPKSWWSWLIRELGKFQLNINDFKKNPREAYLKSSGIRSWLHSTFEDQYKNKKSVKWFNNDINLHEIFTDEEWHMTGKI